MTVQNKKVNSRMEKDMEKGLLSILTVTNMKVNGRMIKDMEKGFIPGLTVLNLKVNGRMGSLWINDFRFHSLKLKRRKER